SERIARCPFTTSSLNVSRASCRMSGSLIYPLSFFVSSAPLELHVPTPCGVREPQSACKDHDRNEQAEARVHCNRDGGLRHRGPLPREHRAQEAIIVPRRMATLERPQPVAQEISAEHPVVQRRAEERMG